MWLARDKDGFLSAHSKKPTYGVYGWASYQGDKLGLPKSEFSEITFENSPVEVTSIKEVKIKD